MAEMEKLSQNSYWESHAISFKSERVKNLHVCYLFVVYYCNINTQEALFLYFFKLLFVDFSFPCFVRVLSCVCVCVRSQRGHSRNVKARFFFFSFFSPPVLWPAASELMLWVSVQFDWKGNRVWEVVLLTVWCLNNPLLCPEWDNGGVCKSSHLLSFLYLSVFEFLGFISV